MRDPEVHCQITRKGEPFKGHDASVNSLSNLIIRVASWSEAIYTRNAGVSEA
jgi:hypothetical protein